MKKPLNLKNYILISLKQVSPQIILLMIKIALFIFLLSIGFAVSHGFNKNTNYVMNHYVSFSFKEGTTEVEQELILTDIRQFDGIKNEFRGQVLPEGMGKLIVFGTQSWIFQTNTNNAKYILDEMNGELIRGSYPKNNNEVIISEELSKGINKTIGDSVGLAQMLNEQYHITGIYKGDANTYISYKENLNGYTFKILENKVDSFYEHIEHYDLHFLTDKAETEEILSNIFFLLKIVGIVILIITAFEVTVSVSNLNKVYFTERLGEFAILQAVGYSQKFILKRMLKELSIIITIGLIAGLLLGQGVIVLFNYLYCVENGIPYQLFNIGMIYFSIALSIVIFLLTYLPTKKFIKKMDWVDVIQENN